MWREKLEENLRIYFFQFKASKIPKDLMLCFERDTICLDNAEKLSKEKILRKNKNLSEEKKMVKIFFFNFYFSNHWKTALSLLKSLKFSFRRYQTWKIGLSNKVFHESLFAELSKLSRSKCPKNENSLKNTDRELRQKIIFKKKSLSNYEKNQWWNFRSPPKPSFENGFFRPLLLIHQGNLRSLNFQKKAFEEMVLI